MEEKSYSQMRQEFIEFYHSEVVKALSAYNKKRQKEYPKLIAFVTAWFSFLALFASLIIYPKLGLYIAPVVIVSWSVLIYLSRDELKKNNGHAVVEANVEQELKSKFMEKFLRIFFSELASDNGVKSLGKNFDVQKFIRKQIVLNPFPILTLGDIISGIFKNVRIDIFESDTRFYTRDILMVAAFLSVLLGFMGFMLIQIVLVFILVILAAVFKINMVFSFMSIISLVSVLILLLLLVFGKKIFQYSPFRGVVIEFNMNKPFKGHTFFHENSLRAKKIPFDKKKYKKVNLESVTFEKKYNVYSDDQIEARYLFTTAFMERIENLSFAFKAKYVRGSFKDDKLVLAIHTGKDMFAMGSDSKDTDAHTFEILYDEMISVLQIVDALKLNEHTGL